MRPVRFFLFLLAFCGVMLSAAPRYNYRDEELSRIAKVTLQSLVETHYRSRISPVEISRNLFDSYFKMLDPSHVLFTQQDVAKFAGDRDKLFQQLEAGNYTFGFAVYEIYRARVKECREFSEKMLKSPIDFTVDESWISDRTKEPFPADQAELKELWRKKLKNDLLYYRLIQKAVADAPEAEKSASKKAKILDVSPEERVLRRLRDIDNDVSQRERIDILSLYLDTLAHVFGPHSGYDSPSQEEDFDIQMKLSLSGIGATLTNDGGFVKIVAIVPGGPAARDGRLKVEDRIIAVTQEDGSTVDLIDVPISKAVRYIRGEEGTRVTLTILPGESGKSATPTTITITRDKVQLVDSAAKSEIRTVTIDGKTRKVGVLTLPSFYFDYDAYQRHDPDARRCSVDVNRILGEFNRAKVDAVVIDLRRNGGGSLPEAIKLAGLFFTTGPVVQVRDRERQITVLNDPDAGCTYTGHLVVLTSKLSASASEIFSSTLKDCNRALIVGDSRTFGKGTILEVKTLEPYPIFSGRNFPAGALTCENAMFFRPSGSSVQQLGIAADIKLPSLTEEMELGEMFLDYHLPWDSIPAVRRANYKEVTPQRIAELARRSAERIAHNEEYQKLLREIELYRVRRDHKTISLKEDVRLKEYLEEKALSDRTESILDSTPEDKDKKLPDPVLDEAVNIAADLSLR